MIRLFKLMVVVFVVAACTPAKGEGLVKLSPVQPASAPAQAFLGTWKGTYTAGQGLTRVTLNVTRVEGKRFFGVFSFKADITNPSVPSGSYTFVAKCDALGESFDLIGKKWIVQPSGYNFVAFKGMRLKKTMSGTVTDQSFGFSVGSFKLGKKS